jgi:glutamyl endopeptidase
MRIGGRRLLSRMVVLGVIAAPLGAALATQGTNATASPTPDDRRVAVSEKFISSSGKVVSADRVGRELASRNAPSYKGTNNHISKSTRRTPSTTPAGGGPATETPISPDRRVQVTTTTTYPARATVWITFNKSASSTGWSCTGFMIAPNVVATAGHCTNFGTDGGTGFFQKSSYRIYPGRNASSSPYLCPGSTVATASQLWTNATWNSSGAETNDYGAITLSCNIGSTTGYFGWTTGGQAIGNEVDTQGYPGDKPSGTQWDADNCSTSTVVSSFVQCTVAATSSTQLFYKNDTAGGQSGSPLFTVTSSGCTCAIGIHAYGLHGSSPHSTNNHGTRVNGTVAAFFSLMRNGGLV